MPQLLGEPTPAEADPDGAWYRGWTVPNLTVVIAGAESEAGQKEWMITFHVLSA